MRWPLATAWTCAVLAAAAFATALVLRGIDDVPSGSAFAALGFAAFSIPALAAGVAIARSRPDNPVGPIVAALGLIPALDVAGEAWADAAVHGEVGGAGWGALLFGSDWIPVFVLLSLLLLLFPDGRPVGPRWRSAVLVAARVGVPRARRHRVPRRALRRPLRGRRPPPADAAGSRRGRPQHPRPGLAARGGGAGGRRR